MNASPTYQSCSHLVPLHYHRNTHPIREKEKRRERSRRDRRIVDTHAHFGAQLSSGTTPSSSCSRKCSFFSFAPNFTNERQRLLSTAEKLAGSSAGRRGQFSE